MTSEEERVCSSCTSTIPKSGYSNTQWSKSSSISKCKYCVAAGGPPAITTSEEGATGEDNYIMMMRALSRAACSDVKKGLSLPLSSGQALALARCLPGLAS